MELITENSSIFNPISDIVDDDIFNKLKNLGLLNEKLLRDYEIRLKYQDYRRKKISSSIAIDRLKSDYPYLQYDTIRKIIYSTVHKCA